MPVHKCSNGKWRIGEGKCMYKSKEAAEKAYRAYKAKKHQKELLIKTMEEIKDVR